MDTGRKQRIDGSSRKPLLIQDTEYVVEKTYNLAQYLGTFGASVTLTGLKSVLIYQKDCWNVAVNLHYLQSNY